MSSFFKGLGDIAGIRTIAVSVTEAAIEAQKRHELVGRAAIVAAEGMVAGQLLSAYIKGDERITLQVQAEKPAFALVVDVNADGSTRSRLTPSNIGSRTKIKGLIMVIKHDISKELYRGIAPIEETNFQGALNSYLISSQQTMGIVRIEAELTDGIVSRAEGFLIEKLPDQDPQVFEDLFGGLKDAPVHEIVESLKKGELWGFPIDLLEEREVVFKCTCSQEKTEMIILKLGAEEIKSLLEEQGQAEVTCHFCCNVYVIPKKRMEELLELALTAGRM